MAAATSADRVLQAISDAQNLAVELSGIFKDGDEHAEQSLSLKQSMLGMIATEQQLKRYNAAVQEVRADIQRRMDGDADEMGDWGELLRSKLESDGAGAGAGAGASSSSARSDDAKAYRQHGKYQEMVRANPRCESDDDSDDDVQIDRSKQEELDMRCPLCMAEYSAESAIHVPLRSKKCGHTYSRLGIDNIFKNAVTIACPIPGCSVMAMQKGDLEEDRVRMAALKRLSKRRKR